MQPGTVVSVVNSYAATSEYTPARFVRRVDFPTDGNPETANTYHIILQNHLHNMTNLFALRITVK